MESQHEIKRLVVVTAITMLVAYAVFLVLQYFKSMYFYGTPTPNSTKIARDLFMKTLKPAQQKIFLTQEHQQQQQHSSQ